MAILTGITSVRYELERGKCCGENGDFWLRWLNLHTEEEQGKICLAIIQLTNYVKGLGVISAFELLHAIRCLQEEYQ